MKASLFPLSILSRPYGWAIGLRDFCYSSGLAHSKRLPCRVISVGNMTVGGTGKTPLVMALAKGLAERGVPAAVLSRGYRREHTSRAIVSDGNRVLLSSEESGDEPFLMAKRLAGIPVLVGKDRFRNGTLALERFGVRALILDDGYQYLRLHRDLDIVLIDAEVGFGDRRLLPRGILREPLRNLRRAHLFLLTKVPDGADFPPIEEELHSRYPMVPLFHSHYEPAGLIGSQGELEPVASLEGKKALVFSGIARPEDFSRLLRKCKMEVIKELVYSDHHRYTANDLETIDREGARADIVVTTEKDWFKLPHVNRAHVPLRALRIEVKIREEEAFFKKVMELF